MDITRRNALKGGTLGALMVALGAKADIVDEADRELELADGLIQVETVGGEKRTYRVGIEEERDDRGHIIGTQPKLHRID